MKAGKRVGTLLGGLACGVACSLVGCVGDTAATTVDAGADTATLTGSEGQACFANGTCDVGLTCASKVCVSIDASGADAAALDGGADASSVDGSADAKAACNLSAPFGAAAPVSGVNSNAQDEIPRLSADELTIYFDSNRGGGSGASDLYFATRSTRTAAFNTPQVVPGVNSASPEIHVTMAPNELSVIFELNQGSGAHLWGASRANKSSAFSGLTMLSSLQAGSTLEGTPFLGGNGSELWYTTDRTSGGVHDLYRATGSGVTFGSPVPVTELNTVKDEAFPSLTADQLTVFWSSNRTDGNAKGANDIWTAHRSTVAAPFTQIANVQELNTSGDDLVGSVSADGCRLYFTKLGNDYDIYMAERPQN